MGMYKVARQCHAEVTAHARVAKHHRWVFSGAPFSSTRTSEIDDYAVRDCTQPSVRTWHGLAPVQDESFHVVKLIEHVKLESAPRVPEGPPKSKSVVLSATPAGNALRAVSLGVADTTCCERPPAAEDKLCDTRIEQMLVGGTCSRPRALQFQPLPKRVAPRDKPFALTKSPSCSCDEGGHQGRAPDLRGATKPVLGRSRRSTRGPPLSTQLRAARGLRAAPNRLRVRTMGGDSQRLCQTLLRFLVFLANIAAAAVGLPAVPRARAWRARQLAIRTE